MKRLEYRTDEELTIYTGLIIVVVGGLALTIAFLITPGVNPLFFLICVILLFGISLGFCKAVCVLKFDMEEKMVVKRMGTFLCSWCKKYYLSDCCEVQVRTYVNGSIYDYPLNTVFYVQLVGKTKMRVPGDSYDFEHAFRKASEIASLLKVPVKFHPSLQFIGDELRKSRRVYT